MRLSRKGAEFIERQEGFRAKPYNDSAGNATVGIGHLMHPGPVRHAEVGRAITRAQALNLLMQDVTFAENAVKHYVRVPLNQHEFDALVSFTFNLGAGALNQATFVRNLNAGKARWLVPAGMLKWNKQTNPHTGRLEAVRGLTARRRREGNLFFSGKYE